MSYRDVYTHVDGVDYSLEPTVLTFQEDSEQGALACFGVEIIDDEVVENHETFYIELSTNDEDVQILSFCQRKSITIIDSDGEIVYIYIITKLYIDEVNMHRIRYNVVHVVSTSWYICCQESDSGLMYLSVWQTLSNMLQYIGDSEPWKINDALALI